MKIINEQMKKKEKCWRFEIEKQREIWSKERLNKKNKSLKERNREEKKREIIIFKKINAN